ncbi:MAG: hypothetical protein JWO08_628, partial [Verrucomicrobiaceae bacterium]|nr:hypothetical protein [Verrucomicrobiaceae bacterium]
LPIIMNPSTHRHQFSGPMPQFNLSAEKTPSLQPQTLSDTNLRPPAMVEALIRGVRWDWLFDVAGNLAGKFRALGMICPGSPNEMKSAVLMGSELAENAAVAAAHSWVVALAQRAAIEIRQLELLEEPRIVLPSDMMEMTCVAFFASSAKTRGTGKRLTKALRSVAGHMTLDCESGATVPGTGIIQMVHSLPVQMVSPLGEEMALPLAAVRIRFKGFETPDVMAALKAALELAAKQGDAGDVLVMSNLWNAE